MYCQWRSPLTFNAVTLSVYFYKDAGCTSLLFFLVDGQPWNGTQSIGVQTRCATSTVHPCSFFQVSPNAAVNVRTFDTLDLTVR